jgi:hypothetical protein
VDEACDAAEEHDPLACLLQCGEGGLDEQGGAEDVGQDHLAPSVGVAVGEGAVGGEPGIGDDGVQPPELVDGGLDGRLDRGVVGRVSGQRQQAGWFAEFLGEAAGTVVVASGDGHAMRLVQQPSGGRRPDAAGAAGDQGDRSVGHMEPHESSGEIES